MTEKKKSGRPLLDPEKKKRMVAISLSNEQKAKLTRLGGSWWIQQQIEKAKDERPEPSN